MDRWICRYLDGWIEIHLCDRLPGSRVQELAIHEFAGSGFAGSRVCRCKGAGVPGARAHGLRVYEFSAEP